MMLRTHSSVRFPARLVPWLIVSAVLSLGIPASTVAHETARLALNAPTCAQEMENIRRTCVQSCEKSLVKSQCVASCNDPKKLLPRLDECEKRRKAG
jgi:hypothetical protein